MSQFFFSGSAYAKLDEKSRFVLPQNYRYGLVENGQLEFTIGLSLGGCLAIYRKSDIQKIVEKFQKKQHQVRYQKFFTIFFSTLHHTGCDKLGRVLLPPTLKKAAGIKNEIVIAGVLNKIELWPRAKYDFDLQGFLEGEDKTGDLAKLTEEAFSLFEELEEPKVNEELSLDELDV